MMTFNRFVVAASVGVLGLFVSQWASASELYELDESTVYDLCVESRDPEAEHDVAEVEALCAAEAASWAATQDVDAYNVALRDVAAAPDFCAVVYVAPDVTREWRAVCVLDIDGETPGEEIRDGEGNVVYRVAGAL